MIANAALPNIAIVENPQPELTARPGEFFLATTWRFDPYLPFPLFPFRFRRRSIQSFIAPSEHASGWHVDEIAIRGPYGKGFSLSPDTHRALVLAADSESATYLLGWMDALIERGIEITLLIGHDQRLLGYSSAAAPAPLRVAHPDGGLVPSWTFSGQSTLPEMWLPPEVEYRVAADVLAEANALWEWADAIYASGSGDFYDELQRTLHGVRPALKPDAAQVLFRDLAMPCGIGLCYACAFKTRRGLVLNCQAGPVFDLTEWRPSE